MRRVCTVLARAGSVGVPGKNVRLLGGVPLIVHSIRHARATGLFDAVVVSTDDPKVRQIAEDEGVDLIVSRPPGMATSTAGKLPSIRHAVAEAESATGRQFDIVVDIQPTSPLRIPEDILAAVRLLESQDRDVNVVTGCKSHKSPYFDLVEEGTESFVRPVAPVPRALLRRQDAPATFDLNGAVYVWWRERLETVESAIAEYTLLHAMPPERSVDIDTEMDFALAELLYERSLCRSEGVSCKDES
jgi:CMP-N,N'-diacetyllegionaminic acid synthase